MSLIRSKKRVVDHGEVFTPPWLVEAMLELVSGEAERIDARFLEPACGSGNFLVPVLRRKLAAVEAKFARSDFNKRHYVSIGIELGPHIGAQKGPPLWCGFLGGGFGAEPQA